jgi:hypothetical protein
VGFWSLFSGMMDGIVISGLRSPLGAMVYFVVLEDNLGYPVRWLVVTHKVFQAERLCT